jgi:hypothetical protein
MEQYRYRTVALVGPWRATRHDAELDALRSGQARAGESGVGMNWLVPGEIEVRAFGVL